MSAWIAVPTPPLLPGGPIVGKPTLHSQVGNTRNYMLTLPRHGPVEGLSVGDKVEMMVTIPAANGIIFYSGVLKGTVARITKNKVRIYLHAEYKPVVEYAHRERLPILVYAIVKKGGSGGT